MAGRIFSNSGHEIKINFVTSVNANATIEVSSDDNANKWSTLMAWANVGNYWTLGGISMDEFNKNMIEAQLAATCDKITEFVRSRNEATRAEIVDHVSHMASPSHVDAALEKLVSSRVLFMWSKEGMPKGLDVFFARRLDANEPVNKPEAKAEPAATDARILEIVKQLRICSQSKIMEILWGDRGFISRRLRHLNGEGKLFRYREEGREDLFMVIEKPESAQPDKLAQEVLSLARDMVHATKSAERLEAEEKSRSENAKALQGQAGNYFAAAQGCGKHAEQLRKEEAQLRRQIREAIERVQKKGGKA